MTKISRRGLLAGTTGLLAATALTTPFVRGARAATNISFRLDWTIYGSHAPFYLALEEKMFEKAGLNVSIGEGQGSGTVAQLVGRNNDQMAFIDFATMIRAIDQGVPIIGVQGLLASLIVIISHADAPVKSPKELEGKIIAFAASESSGQMLPALMGKAGADLKKVSILNPAVGAKNALFLQKRADAIPANVNVQVAELEAQGAKLHYFKYSDFGVELLSQGIGANVNWLKENGEAAKAFIRASREAHLATLANPEKAVDLLIKRLPDQARNKKVLMRQIELSKDSYVTTATKGKPFGVMAEEDWKTTQDNLVQFAGLPKAHPLDKLFTNAYQP
ncbi:MAG: ABC transporter substrate-binding protein, partial [Alphaproteobacteria bacterium]